ncbi:MAG: hypothetical protein MJ239_02180 [Bacilli bacterium]|nr:hypothetical protein [Bacilli bacterium]
MKFNRQETLDLILKEEYGFLPKECEKPLDYSVEEEKVINNIHIQKVIMSYQGYKMRTYLYLPEGKKNVKTFIFVMHEYAENLADKDLVGKYQTFYRYCPLDYVVGKGYGVMLVATREVAPDEKNSKRPSIFDAMTLDRGDSDWGTLQAWSWACRKALDYLYTMPETIDLNNVVVIGHSRGGKTALLTAAQDERFIMAVSSCSGNSGAALARNNTGETIKDITFHFPYWFCHNYYKYAGHEEDLPFDQHQLIGCIAPRYAYVLSATEDAWACPKNELEACRKATEFYEEYGVKGLIAPEEITTDVSYNEGNIGYHYKTGVHCIEQRDWDMVINFLEKHRGK